MLILSILSFYVWEKDKRIIGLELPIKYLQTAVPSLFELNPASSDLYQRDT